MTIDNRSSTSNDESNVRTPSLQPFRDPRSVAVVGASDDRSKWGYWLARGALRGQRRRSVYLINASTTWVQGEAAFPTLSGLPDVPELVVLSVPPKSVPEVVDQGLALGVKAFLGITAGVSNENRLGEKIRSAGARIIGPNSLGLFDAVNDLHLAWGEFTAGPLAIVSQSGQLGSEIAKLGARDGLGISRFISVGNQLDVTATELLADLCDDPQTRIVALYLESFAGGADLVRTLTALNDAGKQTLVLTTGASEGSRRLAESHTGSLTSALDVVDAACRASGAIRVTTPTELISTARLLSTAQQVHGTRTAIVSDSGGQGGIAADLAAAQGLSTPIFSQTLQSLLARALPVGAAISNPVDLAGSGEKDLFTYADITGLIIESSEADAVVLSGYFGCYGEDNPSSEVAELAVVDRLVHHVRESSIPVVVHSMSVGSVAVERMRQHGIPTYSNIESAMNAIAHASHAAKWPGRTVAAGTVDSTEIEEGYWAARSVLSQLGIDLPRGVRISCKDDIAIATQGLAFPVVLKAGWLQHKSEHGGVKLGIASISALEEEYDSMHSRLGDGEYVVEEQDIRPDSVEVLVGGRVDRDFGPLIVVGAGGVETELRRDIAVELAPVDHSTAVEMIDRLECLPLLEGWRGKPRTDIDALLNVVVSVSETIATRANLSEIEVNPIRVSPQGALAVDALLIPFRPTTPKESMK